MNKNEQQGNNEENNVIILSSYIDTNQAHDILFKWIEKQNSENYVRDHFFVNKMQKKYYGCIGFWFKTKSLNPKEKATNIVIIVPGSNKVPEAITELSKYYDYNKFEEIEKEYTPITITDDEAEPKAYELLKRQYPSLFDEFGKLYPNTEIVGTCSVALPIWEGTYNSKYGREHKFFIDAQTGETTGDLYNDKSKASRKPPKRLTLKDIKDLEKENKNVEKNISSKLEKEETIFKKAKEEPKKETENNNEDDEEIEEDEELEKDERNRYILIALIVGAIAILLFISSKILTPNHDPKVPNPQNTSIAAKAKPKYEPTPKVEKTKIEKEKPENFVDSIIKKLVSQKYKEINELMSKNPDEFAEIEGYTNVTSTFENIGELEGYYSKTTSIFPEKTTKIFSQSPSNDNVENKLPDDSVTPNVIKEQEEKNSLISVSTSYIETYNETDSLGNSSENKDRTILIFTLSTEDNKTKIKSVHRKYEQVDESAISQIKENETNSYSEISQNKPDEQKKEDKPKQEENKNNETSYQQPKQEVEYSTNQKPQINLIPEGSTYVENEPPKQEKKNVEEVETSSTTQQTTNSSSNVYSSSEGSESGSAGGSVQ